MASDHGYLDLTMPTTLTKPKKRAKRGGGVSIKTIKSGPALMKWRQERKISRQLFAKMADCSERKLATYEKAELLPEKVLRPVTETMRLIRALSELAGDEAALAVWLETANPAFGGESPLKLIVRGEADVLWEMVHQLRQGAFA